MVKKGHRQAIKGNENYVVFLGIGVSNVCRKLNRCLFFGIKGSYKNKKKIIENGLIDRYIIRICTYRSNE